MQSEYPDTIWAGPPRAYGTGRDGKAVRLSVVHYTAGSSGPGTARAGAAYDQRRTDGTSCHCFHDSAESVQEVWTKDRSNSAFSKGNRLGIHHELCATLQPRSWWLTGVGLATLTRAARASAWDCKTYGLEPRWLSVSEVRAAWYSFPNGPRGICGHVDITRAFPEDGGTHTDPGDGFPRDLYITKVREFLGGSSTTSGDDDMNAEESRMLRNIAEWVGAQLVARDTVVGIANGPGDQHVSVYPNTVLNAAKEAAAGVAELASKPAATIALSDEAVAALGPVVEQAVARALERIRVEVPPAV